RARGTKGPARRPADTPAGPSPPCVRLRSQSTGAPGAISEPGRCWSASCSPTCSPRRTRKKGWARSWSIGRAWPSSPAADAAVSQATLRSLRYSSQLARARYDRLPKGIIPRAQAFPLGQRVHASCREPPDDVRGRKSRHERRGDGPEGGDGTAVATAQPDLGGRPGLRRRGVRHHAVHLQPIEVLLGTRAHPLLHRTGQEEAPRSGLIAGRRRHPHVTLAVQPVEENVLHGEGRTTEQG